MTGTARLQWDYTCAEDVLSAWIGTPQACDDVRVGDFIVIRISRHTGEPVGISVRAASRLSAWTGALDGSVAARLLDEHGPTAVAAWRASRSSG